jgi:1-acyl-sn-glycerol-3-phosphate acyltransferase
MLEFSDSPYAFVPPKMNRLILALMRQYNLRRLLPSPEKRISRIIVTNPEVLDAGRATAGNRLLFLPNHSTHCDPEIMIECQRQLGVRSLFMAAYDIFLRSRLEAWIIQHCGVFSIDRDGSDRRAIAAAMETLTAGSFALTIFPEGNVQFTNDRVEAFLQGAAFIALKATRSLDEAGDIHAVPVSIKATHVTDARPAICQRLTEIAVTAGTGFDRDRDFQRELRRIGMIVLRRELEQHDYPLPKGADDDLGTVLHAVATAIVEALEAEISRQPKPRDTLVDRIRAIRRLVHGCLLDPDLADQHAQAHVWARQAMLAFRVSSYSGDYVATKPTVDRVGETVEKLMEDQTSIMPPAYAERHAYVRLGTPVSLSAYRSAFEDSPRQAVQVLTDKWEEAVQAGLDVLNAELQTPGAELFTP